MIMMMLEEVVDGKFLLKQIKRWYTAFK